MEEGRWITTIDSRGWHQLSEERWKTTLWIKARETRQTERKTQIPQHTLAHMNTHVHIVMIALQGLPISLPHTLTPRMAWTVSDMEGESGGPQIRGRGVMQVLERKQLPCYSNMNIMIIVCVGVCVCILCAVQACVYMPDDAVLWSMSSIQNEEWLREWHRKVEREGRKYINNNNKNVSVFYSAFLNTQRRFTDKKGIHTNSTDTQTKGKK